MQDILVNVNGQFGSAENSKISVFDRGFIYGDSLYEVCRTENGKLADAEEHLARLEKSAQLCHMQLGQSASHYYQEMQRTVDAYRKQPGKSQTDCYVRLIVTRGIGKIGFGLECLMSPTQYVIMVQPLPPFNQDKFESGLKLKIVDRLRNDPRALDPAMKSGNYLNNLLGFLEAAQENFDDALLCNSHGHLTEGTTFNIFYIRRGIIATPPLDVGILDGITRTHVIRVARSIGLEVREVRFPKERLYEADEVFVSSTLKMVYPVTQIDNVKIGKGKMGPISKKLREACLKK